MKNHVQPGDMLDVITPGAVSSGDVVNINALVGIAATDAPSGASVAVATRGVFTLPKDASHAVALGAPSYWDTSEAVATTTSTDNTLIGYATAAALAAATTVNVRIG